MLVNTSRVCAWDSKIIRYYTTTDTGLKRFLVYQKIKRFSVLVYFDISSYNSVLGKTK